MITPTTQLAKLLQGAIVKAYPNLGPVEAVVTLAKDEKHGDYSSNIAMQIAPQVQQPPLDVARNLLATLGHVSMLTKAEVAPPGFINFFVTNRWLWQQLPKVLAEKTYGRTDLGRKQRIVIEYISANPTGPMTLGNGRGAFAGDTLANVMTTAGWQVSREYYLNDIGNQVNILAESVLRRYFQSQGIPTDYPAELYQGEYINEVAAKLKLDKFKLQDMRTIRDRIKSRVLRIMIDELQRTVIKKLNINFDRWVRESGLYEQKLDEKALAILRSHDVVYKKDQALWFRTTAFGDDKDRVLIKGDGEKTYFLSDIALRWWRFEIRQISREVIYLGADHHGYIGRLQAAMAALGFAKQLDVEIVQFVRLMENGQEVKMSKRAGNYVTLEELVDAVGLDVVRFFFLLHSPRTHMDFDFGLAKEKSEKNPVFYVQYAHARICSLLKKTKKVPPHRGKIDKQPSETALIKSMLKFPDLIAEVSQNHETQKLAFYSLELATAFHDFYDRCRVIDQEKIWPHRLQLLQAAQQVLALTLKVMGLTAPERM